MSHVIASGPNVLSDPKGKQQTIPIHIHRVMLNYQMIMILIFTSIQKFQMVKKLFFIDFLKIGVGGTVSLETVEYTT